MKLSLWSSRIMHWAFYLLFIIVPLILTPWNYELFEYNKMMVTYALTIIIAGSWIVKMVNEREIRIVKTPLDIPIALFVLSQLVSTFFSMDPHVSWLGYYSRFNGGMLSIFSYVVLYYAFVSNFLDKELQNPKTLLTFLRITLSSAVVVALYGVAERFGIDKNLWVQDVQNRVFSTLGQPNWLAAYLVALTPLAMAFSLRSQSKKLFTVSLSSVGWMLVSLLFFVVLLFTRSRSGLFGFAVADITFTVALIFRSMNKKNTILSLSILHVVFAISIFFNGSNVAQIDKYLSLAGMKSLFAREVKPQVTTPTNNTGYAAPLLEVGGTESGTIRKYVWQGAVAAWKSTTKTLLIGTGTETFAFAFYRFRPAGHNLTSEWDFLYNKAHNEYLNYLATTGLFGLSSYLLFIGTFVWWFIMHMLALTHQSINASKQTSADALTHSDNVTPLFIALFAGWVSILITNFFGFSVVIVQLLFFLIPACMMVLEYASGQRVHFFTYKIPATWSPSIFIWATYGVMTILFGFVVIHWYADTLFAGSYRLARSGQYIQAKNTIAQATLLNPWEPLYHDENATTLAAIAASAFEQQMATAGGEFAKLALSENDKAIATSPQNVNYWKTRTKLYYTFSTYDPSFNTAAIGALEKAAELSPNDAKIYYNLAILYGREGQNDKAIELLQKSIELKPNYHDAYYALYVFYLELKKPDVARATLEEYLQKVDPADKNFAEILEKPTQ